MSVETFQSADRPSYYTPRDLEGKQENKKKKYLFGEGVSIKKEKERILSWKACCCQKVGKEVSELCCRKQDEHLLMLVLKDK